MTTLEAELWTVLRAIERGEVTVTPLVAPNYIYCGEVEYLASNGWRLPVFNDC